MMGLAHRIIPTVLCRGRELVKGRGFESWRSVGLAMQAIQVHARRGVDEVCLLDITATKENRGPDLDLVSELAEFLFAPLTVGGGVRSVNDVKQLLRAGADSVVIGSAVHVIREVSWIVGAQAVVASVDVRGGTVWLNSGRVDTRHDPALWAFELARAGAGEILLQSIERDGTGLGYDLELVRAVSNSVDIPVIASGGAGNYQHMVEAIAAGAAAVASGAMFQFEDATPRGAARYLSEKGIEVRL